MEDRRYYNIKLTKRGESYIEKIFPYHVQAIVKEFEILKDSELDALRTITKYLGKQERD